MIRAVEMKPVPYVLEDDRGSDAAEQTVFHIMPKRSHEANQTLVRYGGVSRDGRQGYREFSHKKLDSADIEEFVSIVRKVERYGLPTDSSFYGQFDNGIIEATDDKMLLSEIARTMSSAYLQEIFDAAGNMGLLERGQYLGKTTLNLQEKLEKKE